MYFVDMGTQKDYTKRYYEKNKKRLYEKNTRWRRENKEKVAEYNRKYRESSGYAEAKYRSERKCRTKPDGRFKYNQRAKARRAVISGKIKKPSRCEVCGLKKKLEMHHEDYKKPLEVLWTCRNCHNAIHGV